MVLIPMYFLIAPSGGDQRRAAAWKFILYTLLGSVVMLLGLLLIGLKSGTFDVVALRQLFLLCLAGLPPGIIGLFAKVTVFSAAVDAGLGWLAVVMAVNVVIALYYYLQWTAILFRSPENPETASGTAASEPRHRFRPPARSPRQSPSPPSPESSSPAPRSSS
ncbi:NAD(P)H-quinone oxidoreductase subunit 2, chloroplastic [Streptomyces microflavus]